MIIDFHSGAVTADSISKDTQIILEEISRCLNMEKMLQCYKYTVTVECLRSIRKLQKFGHLPNNVDFFKTYAVYGQFKGKVTYDINFKNSV